MKIVKGSIAMSMSALVAALMLGAAGAADAQQFNNAGGMSGAQMGGSNSAGATAGAGTGLGMGAGSGAGPTTGVGTSAGATERIGAGQPLNTSTMRANGTALYMNPDPRAPNVSGRAAPLR